MDKVYPRVLIIGHYFDLSSGGGITMTNLFKGWPKDKIALAGERLSNPDFSVCDNYFQLGYAENQRRFPFYLWQKKDRSGKLQPVAASSSGSTVQCERKLSKKMELYNDFLHFSGLYHYTRRLKFTQAFKTWLHEFAPEIIYTQLSQLETMRFVEALQAEYKLPVVIHIMDDWPSTISKRSVLQSFWHHRIDKVFRGLLNNAKVLMSISDAMSEEYLRRYGKTFIPFHNPINVNQWLPHAKSDYSLKEKFIILYAGRVGTGIENCFFEVAEAVRELVEKGLPIEFHLQSTNTSRVIDEIRKYDFVKIKMPIPYSELPALFSAVDVLLVPNDFDADSISYLRYSMPTKASEYMVTGTPILLYASDETAIVKHAAKNKWARIVSDTDRRHLVKAIEELYHSEDARRQLGAIAQAYALEHYSDEIVRDRFRTAFL